MGGYAGAAAAEGAAVAAAAGGVGSAGAAVAAAAGGVGSAGAAAAGAEGGFSVAAGAAAPPFMALTADWQLGERLETFFCRQASAALPPGGTDAQCAI
jgi:hypothetical protein